LPLIT
jgi:hypothetical protein